MCRYGEMDRTSLTHGGGLRLHGRGDLPLWTKLVALVMVPLLATGAVALWLTGTRLAQSAPAEMIVKEARAIGNVEVLESRVDAEGETAYSARALAGLVRQIPFLNATATAERKSTTAATT